MSRFTAIKFTISLLLSGMTPVTAAEQAKPKQFQTKFAQFPKAYWYAADTWFKELRDRNLGFFDDPVTYMEDFSIEDFSVESIGDSNKIEFIMQSASDPDYSFEFSFIEKDGDWTAKKGIKREGKSSESVFGTGLFIRRDLRPYLETQIENMISGKGMFAKDINKKPTIPKPTYQSLTGEMGSGSGCHIRLADKTYIISSRHQFDMEPPGSFINGSLDKTIPVKTLAEGNDWYVCGFDQKLLEDTKPLLLEEGAVPPIGQPVWVDSLDGWTLAHVIANDRISFKVNMTRPAAVAGYSGSPIIDATTGKVLAILISANDPFKATVVEGHNLSPQEWLYRPREPKKELTSVFGFEPAHLIPEDLATSIQTDHIHPDFLDIRIGMAEEETRESLPELENDELTTYGPAFALDYAAVDYKSKKLSEIYLGKLSHISADELRKLVRFFAAAFGQPNRTISRALGKIGENADYVVLYWVKNSISITIEIKFMDPNEYNFMLSIKHGQIPMDKMVYLKNAKELPTKLPVVQDMIMDWIDTLESIR